MKRINYAGKIVLSKYLWKVETFPGSVRCNCPDQSAETYDPADFRNFTCPADASIACKNSDKIEDPKLYSLCCAVSGMGTAR